MLSGRLKGAVQCGGGPSRSINTWIKFTRWQDLVREREQFEAYDNMSRAVQNPTTGVYLKIEDPTRVIKKPVEEWTVEEKGLRKADTTIWLTELRYTDTSWLALKLKGEYKQFLIDQYDQRFLPERHLLLGPDLAAAHFAVARGASVKFMNDDTWVKASKTLQYDLPDRQVPGLHLEAIDFSDSFIRYEGLENLIDLEHLKMLSFANCANITDWCLDRLNHIIGPSLEYLDLGGCSGITPRGIAALHTFKNLKMLRLGGQHQPYEMTRAALKLEESIPGLEVVGLDYNAAKVEMEKETRLLSHPRVFQDARGNRYFEDDDNELYFLGRSGFRERPVLDQDEMPLCMSVVKAFSGNIPTPRQRERMKVVLRMTNRERLMYFLAPVYDKKKDPPNLTLEEMEEIDKKSDGRLRYLLVGQPSGLDRIEETERVLEMKSKHAQYYNYELHPFLRPRKEREQYYLEHGKAHKYIPTAAKDRQERLSAGLPDNNALPDSTFDSMLKELGIETGEELLKLEQYQALKQLESNAETTESKPPPDNDSAVTTSADEKVAINSSQSSSNDFPDASSTPYQDSSPSSPSNNKKQRLKN